MATKLYPSITDFIMKGDEVILSEKAERSIIQYMEEFASLAQKKEMEAYGQAFKIVLSLVDGPPHLGVVPR